MRRRPVYRVRFAAIRRREGDEVTELTPGEQLRARIAAEYERNGYEPDGREAELIDRACSTAESIAALEVVLDADGPTTKGSRGQVVLHPAVSELRQQRLVLLRLLGALDFGSDDAEQPRADLASQRGRRAAQARWIRTAATRKVR
jgi:hypothetical protein